MIKIYKEEEEKRNPSPKYFKLDGEISLSTQCFYIFLFYKIYISFFYKGLKEIFIIWHSNIISIFELKKNVQI